MKEYTGIQIVSNANALMDAYQKSRKGSDWKESVQKYGYNIWKNINVTRQLLETGQYRQKPFVEFTLCERGKTRHIKSIHISDRVVQRSLCDNVLTPRVTPKLIYDNGASQAGKGLDFTRDRLKEHLHRYYREFGTNQGYILLIDFKNYFGSISHDKLIDAYRKIIPEPDIMGLVEYLIRVNPGGKGLGIGAQLSQNAGIFYPNPIDQYFKTVCREKYYAAYMDDRYLICRSKLHAQYRLDELIEQARRLDLEINPRKTQILPLSHGFTFLKIHYLLTDTGRVILRQNRAWYDRERERLKAFKRISMPPDRAAGCYRSVRGCARRYRNNYFKIRHTDLLFESLYPGADYLSKKERGKELTNENRRYQRKRA
jgi:hypothetical protein